MINLFRIAAMAAQRRPTLH